MADREKKGRFFKVTVNAVGEEDLGFAIGVIDDFDIKPGGLFPEARAERFDNCLFSGKPSRKVGDRVFILEAVVLFACGEEAGKKSDTMDIDRLADAINLDDIVAKT